MVLWLWLLLTNGPQSANVLFFYFTHYSDKALEKQRQINLQSENEKRKKRLTRPPKSEAWSEKKEHKERKMKRREIKEKKREKRKIELTEEDINDLEDDFRMVKKLKNNKVCKIFYFTYKI